MSDEERLASCICEHGPNGPPALRGKLKPHEHEFACPLYRKGGADERSLVDRLRDKRALYFGIEILGEAADEIERLQATVKRLEDRVEQWRLIAGNGA